jgi:restriction endonuclease Mrr
MDVPDFQSITPPLLKLSTDQKEYSDRHEELFAVEFKIIQEVRKEMFPSGTTRTFVNLASYFKLYMLRKTKMIFANNV